jgi:hypothetical protein
MRKNRLWRSIPRPDIYLHVPDLKVNLPKILTLKDLVPLKKLELTMKISKQITKRSRLKLNTLTIP